MQLFSELIELMKQGAAVALKPEKIDDDTIAAVPDGFHIEHLDQYSDKVRRPKERIKIHRGDSFDKYWSRFASENSVCFGDLDALRLHAVIDYHSAASEPAHCDHEAVFEPRRDLGWSFWKNLSGVKMEQRAFQRVLEERLDDIVAPAGADILELVANLEATMKVEASDVQRLDNGSRKIVYKKENQVKGNVTIPPKLSIGVPVFEGGEAVKIDMLLRWDVNEETHKATFILELPDIKGKEQAAFSTLVQKTADDIGDRFYWAAK